MSISDHFNNLQVLASVNLRGVFYHNALEKILTHHLLKLVTLSFRMCDSYLVPPSFRDVSKYRVINLRYERLPYAFAL